MTNRFFTSLVVLLLGLTTLFAQGKSDAFRFSSVQFEYTTSYDDNVLRYSERDIDRFEQNSEFHPSLLSTYDDWKNDFRLKLYFDGPLLYRKPLKIRYFGKFSSYYRNPFNNYASHTLLLYQELSRKVEIDFKYFYIPGYYLREYDDRDLSEYHSCDFDDYQARFGVSAGIMKDLTVTFQTEFENIYYNEYFTEYDSENIFYDFGVSRRLGRNLRILFSYGFRISDNVGYILAAPSAGGPGTAEDTEYGDSSYEEDVFAGEVRWRVGDFRGEWVNLSLEYKLRQRYYTTDNSLTSDPFHAGRADNRHRMTLQADRQISSKFDLGLNYTYEWRNVDSQDPTVVEIKEFSQNVFSLILTYKIW